MAPPELFWTALTVAQFAASIAVTGHALLHKRNTISATAWITLAWFAPGVGAALYLALGINRVERRARRLHRRVHPMRDANPPCLADSPHLFPMDIVIGRITGRPCLDGATVEILRHGVAAYPRMLEAIAGAQTSIALTSYIFRDDMIGRAFIDALATAARRGVQVRVLIDAVGGGYPFTRAWRQLRARDVPAARFLHSILPWRTPILNLRSHRKLLVVDGAVAFTGGLNIGAENLPSITPARRVRRAAMRDTHFRIAGPVVAQAVAVFAEDWRFTTGETLAGPAWFPPLASDGPSFARVVTSGPDHEIERIKAVLLTAIGAARSRIRVMTPYFLPDQPLALALELAALRGVDVGVVVPSRSDNRLVDWSTHDGLVGMIAAGCQVWHCAPPFDHSKLMVVDGTWCMIGSANWDSRSLRLNFELNVEVSDPALAAQLEALMAGLELHQVRARRVASRSLPMRLRDAACRLLLPYL